MWTLSYSFEGKKRVEILPNSLATELAPLVDEGRAVREALLEVLAINLQLLHLWRQEQRARPSVRAQRQGEAAARRRHKKSQ